MQIVIDIPDTEIPIGRAMDTITLFFKNGYVCKCNYPFRVLPKGHGKLKDMDDIYEALEGWNDDTGWIIDTIDSQAPTIIEADKERGLRNESKSDNI